VPVDGGEVRALVIVPVHRPRELRELRRWRGWLLSRLELDVGRAQLALRARLPPHPRAGRRTGQQDRGEDSEKREKTTIHREEGWANPGPG